jgi:hypothetical protein
MIALHKRFWRFVLANIWKRGTCVLFHRVIGAALIEYTDYRISPLPVWHATPSSPIVFQEPPVACHRQRTPPALDPLAVASEEAQAQPFRSPRLRRVLEHKVTAACCKLASVAIYFIKKQLSAYWLWHATLSSPIIFQKPPVACHTQRTPPTLDPLAVASEEAQAQLFGAPRVWGVLEHKVTAALRIPIDLILNDSKIGLKQFVICSNYFYDLRCPL